MVLGRTGAAPRNVAVGLPWWRRQEGETGLYVSLPARVGSANHTTLFYNFQVHNWATWRADFYTTTTPIITAIITIIITTITMPFWGGS